MQGSLNYDKYQIYKLYSYNRHAYKNDIRKSLHGVRDLEVSNVFDSVFIPSPEYEILLGSTYCEYCRITTFGAGVRSFWGPRTVKAGGTGTFTALADYPPGNTRLNKPPQ